MFISHDYKFIFIKTRKTAGSSIEQFFLDKLKGTDFIFSGMGAENLLPINFSLKNCEHNGSKFIKHHYPKEWNNYFKFTIERNPWDKMVSRYYWLSYYKPKKNVYDFDSYIENSKKDVRRATDYPLYTLDDKIAVDYIMLYENLNKEMNYVCQQIGLKYNDELETIRLKSKHRTKNKKYQEYYNDETRDKIARIFSKEINYFKYRF